MKWIDAAIIVCTQVCVMVGTIMVEGAFAEDWPMWIWMLLAVAFGGTAILLYWWRLRLDDGTAASEPASIMSPPKGLYSEEFLLKWQAERKDFLETIVIGLFVFLFLPMAVALGFILG